MLRFHPRPPAFPHASWRRSVSFGSASQAKAAAPKRRSRGGGLLDHCGGGALQVAASVVHCLPLLPDTN